MLLPRPFALGLFAYVRQAALSLHRAPENYREAMVHYYVERTIPFPERVLTEIDRHDSGGGLKVTNWLGEFVRVRFGRSVMLSPNEVTNLRSSLQQFSRLLNDNSAQADVDRISVRVSLSAAEDLLRSRLRLKPDSDAERVEHLNATIGLPVRPLSQIAGPSWPGPSIR